MKMRQLFCLAAVAVFMLCAGVGCKTSNPGVEVGNPVLPDKLVGKIVEITTTSGDYNYHVQIISKSEARVTQFTKSSAAKTLTKASLAGDPVETITTTYTYTDSVLTFTATFANKDKVHVEMNVDTNNKVVTATVQINEQTVTSTVQDLGGEGTLNASGSGSASLAPSDFSRGITANVVLPRAN